MTPDDIRTLIDYNYWARDRVLASVAQLPAEQLTRAMGSSFSSVLDTLTHIYMAEWIWYRRWLGQPPVRPDLSGLVDVEQVRAAWVPLEQDIRAKARSYSGGVVCRRDTRSERLSDAYRKRHRV